MSDKPVYMSIAIGVALVLAVIAVFSLVQFSKPTRKTASEKGPELTTSNLDNIDPALWFHNFLKKPLTAVYYPPSGKSSTVLYRYIPPETTVAIQKKHLTIEKGGKILFMLRTTKEAKPEKIYDYYLLENDTLPKHIYIGMVTTKYLHFASPVLYGGVYEMTMIVIHNRMDIPLTFNDAIHVPPNGRIIYNGFDLGGGVATGEILKNNEGYFAPFEIEIPITDVYFGVVDDKELPLYQGDKYLWQDTAVGPYIGL